MWHFHPRLIRAIHDNYAQMLRFYYVEREAEFDQRAQDAVEGRSPGGSGG